jgi:hypothetical protein
MSKETIAKKRGRPRKSESRALTEVQLKALDIDATLYGRRYLSAGQLARRLGVTRQAVAKWRRDPVWDERLGREITTLYTEELNARLNVRDRRKDRGDASFVGERLAAMIRWARSWWMAPVTSPLDGQLYETPEDLARHYVANDVYPVEECASVRVIEDAPAADHEPTTKNTGVG